ncbi:MAG TPA: invasion associated locus B family protein [Aliidongia sp.]|uniref:invasion associated locus B family protein n=1 Tax=Aliidongia sp. TaxID=1914230 RepID=UPI002DDCADC7|nr:invasion associated locus B family protein [Aliidongia sp.]HEV2675104.1 invasion associated locus B family protein [Aliidongia sp.]
MGSFKTRVTVAAGLAILVGGIGFGTHLAASAKDAPKAAAATTPKAAAPVAEPAKDGKPPVWGRTCQTAADNKLTCVMVQTVVVTDKQTNNRARALTVTVGYGADDGKLRMALTLPLGLNLPNGVTFQIDDGKPFVLPIETCIAEGCRIVMNIDDGGRESLVKSKQIKLSYQLIGGQQVALPIELAGFGDVLAQLKS